LLERRHDCVALDLLELRTERRAVFEASDRIQAELVRRYRRGLPDGLAVPPG